MFRMRRSTHVGCADFLCGTIETLLILVIQISYVAPLKSECEVKWSVRSFGYTGRYWPRLLDDFEQFNL